MTVQQGLLRVPAEVVNIGACHPGTRLDSGGGAGHPTGREAGHDAGWHGA